MSEPIKPALKVSHDGITLIKSFEGFRPHDVRRQDGGWIIGYGHTASAREGTQVSEHEAELLLQYDLLPVVRALNDAISVDVNQHQFDALASFANSIGIKRFRQSVVLKRLNAGATQEAAASLALWPEPAPVDTPRRRRAAERALFSTEAGKAVSLTDLLIAPIGPDLSVGAPSAIAMAAAAPVDSANATEASVSEPDLNENSEPQREPIATATPMSDDGIAPFPSQGIAREPVAAVPITPVVETKPEPAGDIQTGAAVPPASHQQEAQAAPAASSDATDADGASTEASGLGSVLRHEVIEARREHGGWGRASGYVLTALAGLISLGMSIAAFRLAARQASSATDTRLIGMMLLVLAVACIGMAAYGLYRRQNPRG